MDRAKGGCVTSTVGSAAEEPPRRIILMVLSAGLLNGGIWVSATDSSSYMNSGRHFDIPRSTPQMCYILGLGGCRARDDHAACRLASETCSILANQPQLEIAAADPPCEWFGGECGSGAAVCSSFAGGRDAAGRPRRAEQGALHQRIDPSIDSPRCSWRALSEDL